MDKNQIDNTKNLLSEFLPKNSRDSQVVDLNGAVSPAILSGLLGVNVQLIYQYRQDGKLPPASNATYKECMQWYANYWKNKTIAKSSSLGQAALIQTIQLNKAKTEQAWLGIRRERGELVDVKVLAQKYEVHFMHLRMQLCAIAQKHPKVESEIDSVLNEWSNLGEEMLHKSEEDLAAFITEQMDTEPEIEKEEASQELQLDE